MKHGHVGFRERQNVVRYVEAVRQSVVRNENHVRALNSAANVGSDVNVSELAAIAVNFGRRFKLLGADEGDFESAIRKSVCNRFGIGGRIAEEGYLRSESLPFSFHTVYNAARASSGPLFGLPLTMGMLTDFSICSASVSSAV